MATLFGPLAVCLMWYCQPPPLGTKLCSQMESTPVAEKSGVPLPLSTCLTPV